MQEGELLVAADRPTVPSHVIAFSQSPERSSLSRHGHALVEILPLHQGIDPPNDEASVRGPIAARRPSLFGGFIDSPTPPIERLSMTEP